MKVTQINLSKNRNLIGHALEIVGLKPVSPSVQEVIESNFPFDQRPNTYVVLESAQYGFYVLCPINEQEGIISIPSKYKQHSGLIRSFNSITPEREMCGKVKQLYKAWSKDKLRDLYDIIALEGVKYHNGYSLLATRNNGMVELSVDYLSYFQEAITKTVNTGHSFVIVPEYGDGSAHGLIRNHKNCYAGNRQAMDLVPTPIYIPMLNTIGFGDLAINEGIYCLGLGALASLIRPYDSYTSHGIYPGDYSLFDKFPEILRSANSAFPMHSVKARQLELNRVVGADTAKALGFSMAVDFLLERGQFDNVDLNTLLEKFPKFKVAVKRVNDSFLAILNLSEQADVDVLKSYNDTMDLYLQEYIGTQDGELNLMFMVANGNVLPVGFSCETNRLLPNESGGKVGNCSTFHVVGGYNDVLQSIMDHYLPKIQKLADEYKDDLYGWLDVTLLLSDGADLTDPENYKFVEWMVRNAVDNFSVLVSNLHEDYLSRLRSLGNGNHEGLDWGGKNFIVGYDMFQVNFVTPNVPTYMSVPQNFIPVDAGVNSYFIRDEMSAACMAVNTQDLTRLGNFNIGLDTVGSTLEMNVFQMDSERSMSHVPNIAYRGNLVEDWANSLLFELATN